MATDPESAIRKLVYYATPIGLHISDFTLATDNTFAFIRGKWIYEAVLIEDLK